MNAQPERNVVDAWMQHPTSRLLEHPMLASLKRWTRSEDAPTDIPVSATLAMMDEAGVDRSMISAWWSPDGPLISNDEVATFITAAPDRFFGIAAVDLRRPMEAVRELRRAVKELDFRGLRVLPWLWDLPPNDRRYYPLYTECIELGVPFCLQVGHTGPLCRSEPGRPIPYLDDVALDFPELVIVGGHIGFPWTMEMIALATKYPNVYIDTSAYVPKRYPPELVHFLRGHGRKKVLFGSNYPMLTAQRCLAQVPDLGLDDEALDLFLAGNAERIFGLVA